ncbi:MAG: hypothetical protein P4L90_13205 [Rhodopila sp.]|nr:hypothetical protein [Rhodopila sp.]
MKILLAVVTLALTALILEEKTREVAGDAHDAYNETVAQMRDATNTLSQTIQRQPVISLLFAGGLAYVLASIIPSRRYAKPRKD